MSMKNFRIQKCFRMFGQLQGFRKEVVLQVEANMAICKAPVLASQVSMEAQSEKGFKADFFPEGPDQRVWGEFRQNSHTSQDKGSNSRTIINKVFSKLCHSNPVVEISSMVLRQENTNRPTGEL